jgi:phage terminase large subunit-like protein
VSTTSPPLELQGSQKPRVLTRPEFDNEAAAVEAIELAESVGLVLDPWQQLLVRITLAETADGKYAADTVGALVARQNGKGGWLEAVALHGLFIVGDKLTLWTAHQTKTSFEGFLRMKGWIENSDDLRPLVKRINNSHGEEGIELKSGSRLRFLARSKSSGRGFSPQRIFFDEAQELAKVAQEAMLPSMRAQANKQAIYTGTVPGPEINNPEAFARIRDRGRAGGSSRLAWAEWSPKGSADPEKASKIDLDDRKNWADANPALGFRVLEESLESDRESMDDDSYGREALSIWPTTTDEGDPVFGPGRWDATRVEGGFPKPVAVGVAVSVDGDWASIAASDGTVIGSVVRDAGTDWVVAEVARIFLKHDCEVVVDEKGPAGVLIDKLEDAGVPVTRYDLNGYVAACSEIYNRVKTRTVEHVDGDTELDNAVRAAAWRNVGDRRVFGRRTSSGDISTLEAATLALDAASRDAEPSAHFL